MIAVPLTIVLLGGPWPLVAPPPAAPVVVETCQASWYGEPFRGLPTASGAAFDPDGMTAAHRELELGTVVEVSAGSRSVVVEVNDRGPFADVDARCLDLSRAAFAELAPLGLGVIGVEIRLPSGDT